MDCSPKSHVWKATKEPGHYHCTSCSARMPCKDRTCGHLDCIGVRKVTKCYHCGKAIAGAAEAASANPLVLNDQFPIALMTIHGRGRAVHPECVEEAVKKEAGLPAGAITHDFAAAESPAV